MADDAITLRRCIGSARFGIEPHDAPVGDFPKQPSQKDGLGRMCKPHWNLYTAGLARDAKARKAAADSEEGATKADPAASEAEQAPTLPSKRSRRATTASPVAGGQGDVG